VSKRLNWVTIGEALDSLLLIINKTYYKTLIKIQRNKLVKFVA